MADDQLTATLSGIRSRHRPVTILAGSRDQVCESDRRRWPCHAHVLGEALDAVLKLTDDWDAEARNIYLEAVRTADAGEVGAASALQSAAGDLREAITRALTGEGGNG